MVVMGELNFAECFLTIIGCRCYYCKISFVYIISVEEFFLMFCCRRIFVKFDNKTAEEVFFCRMKRIRGAYEGRSQG